MAKIDFFKSCGFSEYESKTLASMVRLKTATPREISFDSGVPQNKLYRILKEFEKQGILEFLPYDVKKYRLINLKSFIENKMKEKEDRIKQIKKSLKNIESVKDDESQFMFSLIKGQKSIMNKLAESNIKVKKEILGVQRNWKVWGKGLIDMKKAIKKGVDVKLIGVIDENTKERAEEWKRIGCKIKEYNTKFGEYPLRFSIIDNKQARITIGKPEIPDPKNYITIWTKSKPLINILRAQFLKMWKESKRF